jgi:hypothetical protein
LVDVADPELVALLERRDGPLPERSWPHSAEGECRYTELYRGQRCPWCEAESRRRERQAQAQRQQ